MIRTANVNDAKQLSILNNEFNGKDETNLDNIKQSLALNTNEIVIVDEENGILVGFVCVYLRKH